MTPAVSPKFPNISIPYGALVPEKLDGLLAVGRHISCDRNSHGFMREIPQCWLTGHAAGHHLMALAQFRDIQTGNSAVNDRPAPTYHNPVGLVRTAQDQCRQRIAVSGKA